MARHVWCSILVLMASGPAFAQFPGSKPILPQGYLPGGGGSSVASPNLLQNYYNRNSQPLSPYLNLLRGTGYSPAVDYYYGVRPGLPSGGQPFNQQPQRGQSFLAASQARTGFLPQAGMQTQADQPFPDPNHDVILPPSGHSVSYGNVFGNRGFAGGGGQSNSRPGFFQAPTTGTKPVKAGTK